MFCEKCGQANADGAAFCESCGAELQPAVQESANYSAAEAPVENFEYIPPVAPAATGFSAILADPLGFVKKYLLWFIIAGATLTLIILLATFGVFKSGSLKAVEKYVSANFKGDGKAFFELAYDAEKLEREIDNDRFIDKEDALEYFKELGEETKEENEDVYGKGLKITKFKHKNTKKYKKDEVKAVNEYLEEVYDYPQNYISALHVVRVDFTKKGKDDDDTLKGVEYVVAKIKGKWYVDSLPGLYSKEDIREVIKNY